MLKNKPKYIDVPLFEFTQDHSYDLNAASSNPIGKFDRYILTKSYITYDMNISNEKLAVSSFAHEHPIYKNAVRIVGKAYPDTRNYPNVKLMIEYYLLEE